MASILHIFTAISDSAICSLVHFLKTCLFMNCKLHDKTRKARIWALPCGGSTK